MARATHEIIPALGYRWLTPLYDPLLRFVLREQTFKRALIEQAAIAPGQRVLDLGCGTGTLTLMIKRVQPDADVSGLDPDPQVLARARAKAAQAGLPVDFDLGLADNLPYTPQLFDRVLSSLMFHHLNPAQKRGALREVRRVLRPAGTLHIADWGSPQNVAMRAAFLFVQLLDGFETTTDHVAGRLPRYLVEAGFTGVAETDRFATAGGTLCLYRAERSR
jgi:ubiquinone/menaquinone biosynthesis C-methylase UbiE